MRLLPGLQRRLPELTAPAADPDTDRYLLYAAVTGMLTEMAAQAPVLLVLDDLQWADQPTLSLLQAPGGRHERPPPSRRRQLPPVRPLGRPCPDRRPRPAAPPARRATPRPDGSRRRGHRGLHGAGGRSRARSDGRGPWPTTSVAVPTATRTSSASCCATCWTRGPCTRRTATGGSAGDLADQGLPQSIREVVGQRVAGLPEGTSTVLAVAAVVGREFDFDLLAAVTGEDEDRLLDLLDGAAEAAVIREVEPGRYAFTHALSAAGPERRPRGHPAGPPAPAHRRGHGGPVRGGHRGPRRASWRTTGSRPRRAADPERTLGYARRAGELALDQLAPDEAIRWYGEALVVYDQLVEPDLLLRCDLLTGLGSAQRQAGQPHRESLREAFLLAREAGDVDRLVRAVLTNSRGSRLQLGPPPGGLDRRAGGGARGDRSRRLRRAGAPPVRRWPAS